MIRLLIPLLLVAFTGSMSFLVKPQQRAAFFKLYTTRRNILDKTVAMAFLSSLPFLQPEPSSAVGPVKIKLKNEVYTAVDCPKDKPIPGEKAMQGMRGMCVTVTADLEDSPQTELTKVGVYGFVNDGVSGDSVLANNPDNKSDAGQFAIIEVLATSQKSVKFEFVAAIPKEKDISAFDNGIGPLKFQSLKIVSYPGGQQYGAISPCEMNEFSNECEEWEETNGQYEKEKFMIKSNERTKGR
ncbi:hypothetical protein ScalyP_jg3706 [Parmales sp. scaly parma]|nr:hypothetical protein ScalyP_jg3706 [Parmales sp. scaly parma]